MKKAILFITFIFISFSLQASPNKAEADKWYKDFRAAKDKVFDGSFVTKVNEHMKQTQQLAQLRSRAEKLFGEPLTSKLANCTVAAYNLQTVWSSIAEIARKGQLDNRTPAFIAVMAWTGGENYPVCIDEIDKLK